MEVSRLVSSGTEAVMSAIRAARGFTGRDKIVKFRGCYHGHSDSLLVKAGSGALTTSVPDSAGVPKDDTKNTLHEVLEDMFTSKGANFNSIRIPIGSSDFHSEEHFFTCYYFSFK